MGIPPSESIKPCRARSRSVLALNASRSINASAAVVWMKPGATEFTLTPLGPTSLDKPLL
jgi:hypothetical protein